MIRMLTIVGLSLSIIQAAFGADRVAEFEKLVAEYEAANEHFNETHAPKEHATATESIERYAAWPCWKFLPQFVALMEARPDDEAAFRCCQWIFDRTRNAGNDEKPLFEADQKAWATIAAHHTGHKDLPLLCMRAAEYPAPAREQFLRGLVERTNLSRQHMGFARASLAELLARRLERIETRSIREALPTTDEFLIYILRREAPELKQYLAQGDAARIKAESIKLLRRVHSDYADVPAIPGGALGRVKNLGEKAARILHALEHLALGAEPPNIVGKDLEGQPLELGHFRGRVVLLMFWSTDCGPCMSMIPDERKLVATYAGRPFAMLSVCVDQEAEQGLKTAKNRGIDWPCWFDGSDGPIARDYNVHGLPTIYLLDPRGVIVAKHLRGEALEAKIGMLMAEAK